MKRTIYQSGLILLLSFLTILNAQATKTLNEARIYINPGHGGWGSNDRPLATINYAIMDTLGFFETKSSLMKSLALRTELERAGAGYIRMSRTRNGIAPNSQGSLFPHEQYERDVPGQIVTLSVICEDVETNNMDYFISIHSNAAGDGSEVNFPLLLYRGTDEAPGNGLTEARNMARAAWKYIAKNGITYYNAHSGPTANNSRGDISFYHESSTSPLGYTGRLGVLKHGCDGYLSEGCFHTYHPERHRLLNRDYCNQFGTRYARAIRSWFGDESETTGDIMGTVKDKHNALTHSLYKYKKGSMDQYHPLNEVKVVLLTESGDTISSYTTDKEYNGVYVFEKLTPGKYQLVYDIEGYWKETETIEVLANETSFINKLLTDTSHPEPGEGEEEEEETTVEVKDFPHPVQDGDIAAANNYNFSKADEKVFNSLEGKTIRRAILRDGKYYILAVDAAKSPELLVINPETGELIKQMSTDGLSTEGYNGKSHLYVLSDIAFTQDGVLLGVNSTVVGRENNSFQTGDFYVYKWQANDSTTLEDVKPEVVAKLPTNKSSSLAAAGNNYSNLVANSFTVSGTLKNLYIFFDSHPSDNWGPTDWEVRYVSWYLKDSVVTSTQYNDTDLGVISGGLGEDAQISLSPTAPNRFIIDGDKIAPFELEMNWTANDKIQTGTFSADIPLISKGTNYFRYAHKIYMSTPVCEKQADESYSYKMHLYDITKGLSEAVKVGETEVAFANEANLSYMTAYGVVDNADIDLYLLVGNKMAKFTTKGNEQQASPARIFAYGLSSSQNEGENSYKINFTLNEQASDVVLTLTNPDTGEAVKSISLGAKDKGDHEYTLDYQEIPEEGTYNWQLEVSAPNVTRLTKLSNDAAAYKYFAPKGIAIDNSPESPYFGRVYITNTMKGESSGRNTNIGIYVISPDASDITNQGDSAYNGGIAWTGQNGEGPRKLTVTNDGRVFIADASKTNAGIYYMNPQNFEMNSIFPNATVSEGSVKINNTYVCGQIVAIGSRGSGTETELYAVDKTASGKSWIKHVNLYTIGENNTWEIAPTASKPSRIGNDNSSIIPDINGYWAGQYRGPGNNSTSNPCMFYHHFEKENVFNSADFKDKYGEPVIMDKASQNGGLAIDKNRKLAVLSYDGGIYVFEYKFKKDTVPVVYPKFQHPLDVEGVTYDDFAFDYAGNLYALSNSGKFISVWAMPTDNNSCTTPAAKALKISKLNVGIKLLQAGQSVYPNPTDGIITIESTERIRTAQIYDLSGRLVIHYDNLKTNKETIDVSKLESGSYLVRINGSSTVKFTRK